MCEIYFAVFKNYQKLGEIFWVGEKNNYQNDLLASKVTHLIAFIKVPTPIFPTLSPSCKSLKHLISGFFLSLIELVTFETHPVLDTTRMNEPNWTLER